MEHLGKVIKKQRIKKNLKQTELAKIAGISNTYLSDIEVGRTSPSIKTLKLIAGALEINVKELL